MPVGAAGVPLAAWLLRGLGPGLTFDWGPGGSDGNRAVTESAWHGLAVRLGQWYANELDSQDGESQTPHKRGAEPAARSSGAPPAGPFKHGRRQGSCEAQHPPDHDEQASCYGNGAQKILEGQRLSL